MVTPRSLLISVGLECSEGITFTRKPPTAKVSPPRNSVSLSSDTLPPRATFSADIEPKIAAPVRIAT